METLEAIVQDAEGSGTLADLRLATACLLAFLGFLQFSELINLRPLQFKNLRGTDDQNSAQQNG